MASSKSAIDNEATREHVVYCWDVLVNHYAGKQGPEPPFENAFCPLFVTWKKRRSLDSTEEPLLRGCIGTLDAKDLHSNLGKYTLISALQDRRFNPIAARELEYLDCTVSLLTNFEKGLQWDDWEVGTHGMIIEFEDPNNPAGYSYSATYLPEVAHEQGWTREECIDSLISKAGYTKNPTNVRLNPKNPLRLTRYQSSLCTVSYQEYLAHKEGK
ncbi:hypothetical protein A3770_04p32180 [Chloropicon primus]|uniref:AMMECR1 domain-containing protein n=1 Tax=Chloropicon primus TaxID=1764295 RepID=A0A5B8MN20_9CHLO|nr:hypothetical protein A3770_04p32180 [Chloropicon primus]|eukprot:QDZ20700.1 hypothetical protein A3770_04p32180 [Chloropicon primus]